MDKKMNLPLSINSNIFKYDVVNLTTELLSIFSRSSLGNGNASIILLNSTASLSLLFLAAFLDFSALQKQMHFQGSNLSFFVYWPARPVDWKYTGPAANLLVLQKLQ